MKFLGLSLLDDIDDQMGDTINFVELGVRRAICAQATRRAVKLPPPP